MTGEEIEAIVSGYHGDAFRILGPHSVRKKGRAAALGSARVPAAGRVGRPWSPAATAATWRRGTRRASSSPAWMASPPAYAIRARLWDGREVEIDDPYRFGPQISDSDLYLHTEGTLYEGWRTLGAHVVRSRRRRAACASPCGRRTRRTSRWPASSTIGTCAAIRCGGATAASGSSSCPGSAKARAYKYNVRSRFAGYQQLKADPYAFYCETPPKSASRRVGHSQVRVAGCRVDGARAPRPTC